jgi:hypothetical protein
MEILGRRSMTIIEQLKECKNCIVLKGDGFPEI